MIVTITALSDGIEINVDGIFLKKFSKKLFGKYFKTLKTFKNKNQIDEWLCEIEAKVAAKYAYQLLSYKSYPSHLLLQKLKDVGIRLSIAQSLIEELKKLGYLDDEAFIEYLVKKDISKGYGLRYIRLKLLSKHFCAQTVETKLQKLASDNVQKDQIEKAYKKLKTKKSQKQIFQYFLRKGFDGSLIQEIISWQES